MAEQNENILEVRKKFGVLFSEAIQSKNLSYKDISQSTKILPQFVKALQEGDFDQLPGKVFGAGFVKNICKTIDLDSKELVELYKEGWENSSNLEVPNKAVEEKFKKDPILKIDKGAGNNHLKLIAIGAFVLVAIIISIFILSKNTPKQESKSVAVVIDEEMVANLTRKVEEIKKLDISDVVNEAEKNTEILEEVDKSKIDKAVDKAKVVVVEEKKEVLLKVATEKTSNSLLRIVVKEKVKIKYKIDTSRYDVKEFEPDIYQFEIKEVADLLIYDASAVEIKYGGRSLGRLGGKGRIRRLRFTKTENDLEKL